MLLEYPQFLRAHMPEPASSTASGFAAYKLAVAFGVPTSLAAIVVMLWIQPKSRREWAMALICTVVSSICGGAIVIEHYSLQAWTTTTSGLMAMGGIIFACGLPGWVLVRAGFKWFEKRNGKDLGELIKDAKDTLQ